MNPTELLLPGGKPAGVYQCGVCGKFGGLTAAAQCCACSECSQPTGKDDYTGCHQRCYPNREARQDAIRVARAQRVAPGEVEMFLWGDDFRDIDGVLDELAEPADHSEHVWAAERRPFPALDAGDIYRRLTENIGDDAEEVEKSLNGRKEFEAACEAFNAANADYRVYDDKHKRYVLTTDLLAILEKEKAVTG